MLLILMCVLGVARAYAKYDRNVLMPTRVLLYPQNLISRTLFSSRRRLYRSFNTMITSWMQFALTECRGTILPGVSSDRYNCSSCLRANWVVDRFVYSINCITNSEDAAIKMSTWNDTSHTLPVVCGAINESQ